MVYSEFVLHMESFEKMKKRHMIRFTEFERYIGIQIFGDDPESWKSR